MRADRRKQQLRESLWGRKIHTEGPQMKTLMLRLKKTTQSLICQVDLSLSLRSPVLLSLFGSSFKNNFYSFTFTPHNDSKSWATVHFPLSPLLKTTNFPCVLVRVIYLFAFSLPCLQFPNCGIKNIIVIPSDFLNGKHFFLYGKFPNNDRRLLLRYIVAFNGWVWHGNYTVDHTFNYVCMTGKSTLYKY